MILLVHKLQVWESPSYVIERRMAASTSSPDQLLNPNLQTQLLHSPFKGNCSLRGPQIQAPPSNPHLQSPAQVFPTLRHTRASIQRATPAGLSSFPMPTTRAQALTGNCGPHHHSTHREPWSWKSPESTASLSPMSQKLFGFSEHQSPNKLSSNGESLAYLTGILRGFDKILKTAFNSAWDMVSAHHWKL